MHNTKALLLSALCVRDFPKMLVCLASFGLATVSCLGPDWQTPLIQSSDGSAHVGKDSQTLLTTFSQHLIFIQTNQTTRSIQVMAVNTLYVRPQTYLI